MSQVIEFEGQQHEFPDDFSQAEIAHALSSVKPPDASSLTENGQYIADQLKTGNIQSALFGPNFKPSLINFAGGLAKNFAGGIQAPGQAYHGDLAPQIPPTKTPGILTEEDQFLQNLASDQARAKEAGAAGQMLGALATGGLPGGMFAGRGAFGQIGSPGFMGRAAREVPDRPGGGGVAIGNAQQTAEGYPYIQANPAASAEQMVAKAGDIQNATGVPINIPRYLVDPSRGTQGMAEGLKNIPAVGDKIAASAKATQEALGTAVGKTQEGFGSGVAADVGSAGKDALANWIGPQSRKIADRVYDVVDKHIDPAVTTELSATKNAAKAIMDRRAAASIPGSSKAVDTVTDAINKPGGLTYEGVKDLRTFMRDLKPEEIVNQGFKAPEVEKIYNALTQDLRSATLNAGGPKALTAFNKANDIYQQISTRREAVAKVLGIKGDATPETVLARVMTMAGTKSNADIGRLAQVRKAMGAEAWNEVASGVIAKLGRDPGGQFSIQRFLGPNGYNGLSPAGRSALFKTTGKDSLGKSLDDIAFLSKEIQNRLDQYAKNPGTARSLIATLGLYGIIHHPIAILGTTIAGNRLANLVTEPATARMTADWMRAYRNAIAAPNAGSSRAVREAANKLAGILVPQGADPAMIASRLIPGAAIAPQPPQ